jgi:coenzyme PQQ precursor peptide PqqA
MMPGPLRRRGLSTARDLPPQGLPHNRNRLSLLVDVPRQPTSWDVSAWHVRTNMAWTTPTLVEICIGLEINGYLPAEF